MDFSKNIYPLFFENLAFLSPCTNFVTRYKLYKDILSILIFFKLIGSLALLMYGMKSMSESLQKMAGSQLRHVLGAMTTNRFTGMLTGMFVTASVQSSTATTVMTVSFVVGTSHIRHHGCKHRYDTDGMDHECRLLV